MHITLLSLLAIAAATLLFIKISGKKQLKLPIVISGSLVFCALAIWYTVPFWAVDPQNPDRVATKADKSEGKTIDAIIEEIQDQLREDRNNADLWFQLGQGYFANGEFESASTCFSYVLRLTDEPSSTVFAAKATADYYISSQRITDQIQQLLDIALEKDPLNDTALMLIANDHFISFRYKKAIEVWQSILDSDRPNIDRVTIINSINKTKEMMN